MPDPARLAALTGPFALVLARAAGLAWAAPAWGTPGLGARPRLVLAAVLAAVLLPTIGPGLAPIAPPAGWLPALLVELAVGAVLGGSAGLVVAAARQAGELVGAQAGLSAASLLDPEAGPDATPLGHLYGLLALATFLALDGPLELVRALAESYRAVPAGAWSPSADFALADRAFARLGAALLLTLRAAAPVALALILAGLALGLLNRAAPALPLAGLALPARAAIGLLLALLGLGTLAATLAAAWGGFLVLP